MAEVLFINEEFFKKNISHRQSFDTNQVISSIRLVQKTNLKSIISDPVYDDFQTKLKAATVFTAAEEKLFESMQLFLAVKTAEEMSYSAPTRDGDTKDDSHISYRNKSVLMEARIVRDINRDATLLALAQSGTEDFDDEAMSDAGSFYFL
jgi:hypothetical protein